MYCIIVINSISKFIQVQQIHHQQAVHLVVGGMVQKRAHVVANQGSPCQVVLVATAAI